MHGYGNRDNGECNVCADCALQLVRKHNDLYDIHFMYSECPALFGEGPQNTHWQMVHGDGGGYASLSYWGEGMTELWERVSRE